MYVYIANTVYIITIIIIIILILIIIIYIHTSCIHPRSWVRDTFSRCIHPRGLLHQVHDIRVILVLSNVPGIAHDVLTWGMMCSGTRLRRMYHVSQIEKLHELLRTLEYALDRILMASGKSMRKCQGSTNVTLNGDFLGRQSLTLICDFHSVSTTHVQKKIGISTLYICGRRALA